MGILWKFSILQSACSILQSNYGNFVKIFNHESWVFFIRAAADRKKSLLPNWFDLKHLASKPERLPAFWISLGTTEFGFQNRLIFVFVFVFIFVFVFVLHLYLNFLGKFPMGTTVTGFENCPFGSEEAAMTFCESKSNLFQCDSEQRQKHTFQKRKMAENVLSLKKSHKSGPKDGIGK